MIRVLFVCLGNICRSPMAEGIFRHKVIRRGLENHIQCDSAGTIPFHTGSKPDVRTMQVCIENQINLTHSARVLTQDDFLDFDYIVAMDEFNRRDVEKIGHGKGKAKVVLMRDYGTMPDLAGVPDPYRGRIDDFYNVYEILDHCIDDFIARIESEIQSRKKHYNIKIDGRVQGVFFRKYASEKANELHLAGFVMNMPDRSVYIEVEGEEEDLLQFTEWCKKGSPGSRVDEMNIESSDTVNFKSFEIRRSGGETG